MSWRLAVPMSEWLTKCNVFLRTAENENNLWGFGTATVLVPGYFQQDFINTLNMEIVQLCDRSYWEIISCCELKWSAGWSTGTVGWCTSERGQYVEGCPRDEYQVFGSCQTWLVYWEPFSWLTSVGTTRNTVVVWIRIGLVVQILHAAGVGPIGRPAVISGRYNKCHSWYIRSFFGFTFLNILYFFKYSCTNIFHRRSLHTFYSYRTTTHTFRHCNTHILMQKQTCGTGHGKWSWVSGHCMLAVAGG